jgi:hypothetical protein
LLDLINSSACSILSDTTGVDISCSFDFKASNIWAKDTLCYLDDYECDGIVLEKIHLEK